jgi:uncharacterized protein YlxW (UPF0749 family)
MSTPAPQQPDAGSTGAAATGRVSDRRRLLRALLRPGKGQIIAAVLLLALGYAAVTQVRAHGQSDSYAGARQSDLVTLLNSLSLATSRMQREVSRLTETRDSLQTDSNSKQTALDLAKQQASTLAIIAGTVPVVGPGVRVTIHDSASVVSVESLLNGVSELRDAGAEAIAINGTRVVASTAFEQDNEGHLVVGGSPLQSPYVIDVIGDPQTLKSAVSFEGGFAFEVRAAGARLNVQTSDAIEIAAVVTVAPAQYATPSTSE